LCLTPIELDYELRAYQRKQENKWIHTRWLGALILNSQRSSKQPAIKPEDLVTLQIDKAHKESSIKELKARLLIPRFNISIINIFFKTYFFFESF
jgi:hypothetical protein